MKNEIFKFRKTIMPKSSTEMYKKEFQERHKKAFVDDIRSLSNAINNNFPDEKVTVWHCCTSNGGGYYTVSNGEKKRFVHSKYRLECVGGCWSLYVYERLYMGQVNLMKFLDAIKAEICKNHLIEMPLKTMYIAYILTNLEEWENSLKGEYYHRDDKRNFEIARKYQKEFTEQYPEQIEIYNDIVANGGNFWSYYNGSDNYEYSCVSDILENAVCEIYKNREHLEACELWKQARKVIDVIAKCSINNVSTIEIKFIKHGKWKRIQNFAICSECRHEVNWGNKDFLSPYCPNCGTEMKKDWNSNVRQHCSNNGEMKIYSYFDNDYIKVYDAVTIEELSPKMLSCVCAFQYTTLGAMGLGGIILMFDENGNSYSVSYYGEEIKQDVNGNNIHNVYETYAYDYVNKYLDLEDKIALPRREWRMEKDGWTTITNGLGWYIACRNDVLYKIPEINVFEDVEDVMFHFPDYFGE